MIETCARFAVVAFAAAACLTACESAPQPVKEKGWDAGTMSAADAPAAPEVLTAQVADQTAEAVVASAMESVVRAQTRAGGGPNEKKPAPVIAVASLEAAVDIHTTPGPDASADEVARWLSAAWKREKPPAWIREQLDRKKPGDLDQGRIRMLTGDFNADDKPDLAVAFLADCANAGCAGHGAASSAARGGKWTVGVIWGHGGWSHLASSERSAPKFVGPVDLTGDAHPELVFTIEQCGAHTCYKNVQVLSAHRDQRFRRILYLGDDVEGHGSRGLPQKVEIVRPTDTDERAEHTLPRLEVSGGLVGSAGAGMFQRRSHTTWAFAPEALPSEHGRLEPVGTRWAPSTLRLHRFHDAIVALAQADNSADDRADTRAAEALLDEVIASTELRELPADAAPDPALAEAMRTQLAHTARFMLARLALERGDTDRFARLRDELQASAPKSPATRAVVTLGESWRGRERAAAACKAAAAVFPEEADDQWVLDSFQLGYNAPVTFDADFDRGLCAGLGEPAGS